MHEVNLEIQPQNEKQLNFYKRCLEFWDGGAVNVTAGVNFLARECARRNEAKEEPLNMNTDPGVRLVLAHIGFLTKLDGIGGWSLPDPKHPEKPNNITTLTVNKIREMKLED